MAQRFPSLPWDQVIDRVSKATFLIEAHEAAGTGFVLSVGFSEDAKTFHTMLATAWHVLRDSEEAASDLVVTSWDRKRVFSSKSDRLSYLRLGPVNFDTALIYLETQEPVVDVADLLPIFPTDSMLARGSNVGWLGFPAIAEPELCFFKGIISGYLSDPPAYLADGVAISGVSGGPVFDDRCHLVGMVSAYLPNQLDEGTLLPGLSCVTPINAIRYWLDNHLNARDLSKAV
jgi:hypothetical protein